MVIFDVPQEALDGETCSGRAQRNNGECRMDMVDSDMGYLGYDGTEAYGLTWKVRCGWFTVKWSGFY